MSHSHSDLTLLGTVSVYETLDCVAVCVCVCGCVWRSVLWVYLCVGVCVRVCVCVSVCECVCVCVCVCVRHKALTVLPSPLCRWILCAMLSVRRQDTVMALEETLCTIHMA